MSIFIINGELFNKISSIIVVISPSCNLYSFCAFYLDRITKILEGKGWWIVVDLDFMAVRYRDLTVQVSSCYVHLFLNGEVFNDISYIIVGISPSCTLYSFCTFYLNRIAKIAEMNLENAFTIE